MNKKNKKFDTDATRFAYVVVFIILAMGFAFGYWIMTH